MHLPGKYWSYQSESVQNRSIFLHVQEVLGFITIIVLTVDERVFCSSKMQQIFSQPSFGFRLKSTPIWASLSIYFHFQHHQDWRGQRWQIFQNKTWRCWIFGVYPQKYHASFFFCIYIFFIIFFIVFLCYRASIKYILYVEWAHSTTTTSTVILYIGNSLWSFLLIWKRRRMLVTIWGYWEKT